MKSARATENFMHVEHFLEGIPHTAHKMTLNKANAHTSGGGTG